MTNEEIIRVMIRESVIKECAEVARGYWSKWDIPSNMECAEIIERDILKLSETKMANTAALEPAESGRR